MIHGLCIKIPFKVFISEWVLTVHKKNFKKLPALWNGNFANADPYLAHDKKELVLTSEN